MEAAAGTPSSGATAVVQAEGAAIAGGGEEKAFEMDKSSRATKVKAPKTKVAKVFHKPSVKPKDIEATIVGVKYPRVKPPVKLTETLTAGPPS